MCAPQLPPGPIDTQEGQMSQTTTAGRMVPAERSNTRRSRVSALPTAHCTVSSDVPRMQSCGLGPLGVHKLPTQETGSDRDVGDDRNCSTWSQRRRQAGSRKSFGRARHKFSFIGSVAGLQVSAPFVQCMGTRQQVSQPRTAGKGEGHDEKREGGQLSSHLK